MKLLLITILTIFCLNNIHAQAHDLRPGSCCMLTKERNTECTECTACSKIRIAERKAIVAEDKRRADVLFAKAKAENEILQKAYDAKLVENAKKAESGKVYINGNDYKGKTITPAPKTEQKSATPNYFYSVADQWTIISAYTFQGYFDIPQKTGFIINNDTVFGNNQFKKCIGLFLTTQVSENHKNNEFNFPPNIGIVILNEKIPKTSDWGRKVGQVWEIADLIDIKGKRLLNDDNVTAILHFADDYFILFKRGYSFQTGIKFDDAVIYNYKTKVSYPISKNHWGTPSVDFADIYTCPTRPGVAPSLELLLNLNQTNYKAFFVATIGLGRKMVYYVSNDGKIEEQAIAY